MSIPGTLEVSAVWTVGGGATGAGGGCTATRCAGTMSSTCWTTVWWILELRYRAGGGLYVAFVYIWGHMFFG